MPVTPFHLEAGSPRYVPGSFVFVHRLCLAMGLLGLVAWFVRVRHDVRKAGSMPIEGV